MKSSGFERLSGRLSLTALFAVLLVCWSTTAFGQGLTGQLSGSITDPSGSAIPNATVQIANSATKQTRSTKPDQQGRFVFTELLPGTFVLTVDAPGFKKYEQREISVTAAERVTLPPIALQVGAVTETVSVTGQTAAVQTESAERSGLITSREMQEIPLKGRSYMGTAKLLAGHHRYRQSRITRLERSGRNQHQRHARRIDRS